MQGPSCIQVFQMMMHLGMIPLHDTLLLSPGTIIAADMNSVVGLQPTIKGCVLSKSKCNEAGRRSVHGCTLCRASDKACSGPSVRHLHCICHHLSSASDCGEQEPSSVEVSERASAGACYAASLQASPGPSLSLLHCMQHEQITIANPPSCSHSEFASYAWMMLATQPMSSMHYTR